MRNTLLAAATSFALFASIGTASVRDIAFTVVNNTGATLDALYGGPSSSDDWGSNVLDSAIDDGGSVKVTITDTTVWKYDFRYEVEGKDPYEEYAIDICAIDGQQFVIK